MHTSLSIALVCMCLGIVTLVRTQFLVDCSPGYQCVLPYECAYSSSYSLQPCAFRTQYVCCPILGTHIQRSPKVSTEKTPSEKACNNYVFRKRLLGGDECNRHVVFARSLPILYQPAIYGGVEAKSSQFGHMALLGHINPTNVSDFCVICGGTLINEQWVMTAAHCIAQGNCAGVPNIVRLGDHDITVAAEHRVTIPINKTIVHPNYSPPSQYNDIALLKLDRNVDISQQIYPACLPKDTHTDYAGESATVTGWGQLSFGGRYSHVLQEASVTVQEQHSCQQKFGSSRFIPEGIKETQLCAGERLGGVDACAGDSGGPLQQVHKNVCIYDVIGIVSIGIGCGDANYPGVYTRVSKYVPWIESIVWPSE